MLAAAPERLLRKSRPAASASRLASAAAAKPAPKRSPNPVSSTIPTPKPKAAAGADIFPFRVEEKTLDNGLRVVVLVDLNAQPRGETSGICGETNVPCASAVAIHPSAASSRYAASTVLRWTPRDVASVREPGSASPALSRPRRMSSEIARAMRRNVGPVSAAARSMATVQLLIALV